MPVLVRMGVPKRAREQAMLWNMERVRGYTLAATDGHIGKVVDLYVDDAAWTVRYFVVDTGTWLSGRQVLIAPLAVGRPDGQLREFPVPLTRQQIENSPDIETDKPVSRRQEEMIQGYYGWPPYWLTPVEAGGAWASGFAGHSSGTDTSDIRRARRDIEEGDPHLRSAREVEGYHIATASGEVGHVEDFLIDDDGWIIRYLVIDTRNWLPGRKVLLAPHWVERIEWSERRVYVSPTRDAIRSSPPYDPSAPVDRPYEERLFRHYGQEPYWDQRFYRQA